MPCSVLCPGVHGMWNSVGQWGSAFHTRYEVLTAMKIQVTVFWLVTL